MADDEERIPRLLGDMEIQMAVARVALDVAKLSQIVRANIFGPGVLLRPTKDEIDNSLSGINETMMTLCGKLLGEEDERIAE